MQEKDANIVKQRAKHEANFTILHNEILKHKDSKDKRISLESLGLFWTIMSLPPYWNLSIRGLSVICSCSTEKIKKCLDELISFGYIERKRYLKENKMPNGQAYFVYETLDKTLWREENEPDVADCNNELKDNYYEQDTGFQCSGKQNTGKQNAGFQCSGFRGQLNIINNKENNNKEFKELNIIKINSRIEDSCCESQSQENKNGFNLNISSKNNPNKITNENAADFETVSNLMNVKAPDENPRKKPRKEFAVTDKNKVEQMRQEKGNTISTVETQQFKKLGDLTELDNEASRILKQANAIKEAGKVVNERTKKNEACRTRITKQIQKDFTDPTLVENLKGFLDVFINVRGAMANATYNSLKKQLLDLSPDVNIQNKIVEHSVLKGYTQFYLPKEIEVKPAKPVLKIDVEDAKYDLVLDENGKPITF